MLLVEFNKKKRMEWATQQIHSPDVQNKVVPMSLGAQPKQTHRQTHTQICVNGHTNDGQISIYKHQQQMGNK